MADNTAVQLHEAIEAQQDKFSELYDVFGPGELMVRDALHELEGLYRAFTIVTGQRYIDWWLAYQDAQEAAI